MKKVNNILEHTDCISEEMLLNYIADKLSPAEKHLVERHLVDCEMCADAVDGLRLLDAKKIPSITSELNQKIQERISEKKTGKVVFLKSYRVQLAAAASILLIVGLVWFFRSNDMMKELDSTSAEKMFSEKFEPPPSEKVEETPTPLSSESAKEQQTTPDVTTLPVTAGLSSKVVAPEAAEKKVATGSVSSLKQEVKVGKDIAEDENHLDWKKNNVAQKSEQAQADIPKEEKEKQKELRNKTAEVTSKGNVGTESEVQPRDEDIALISKEVSKNQNELNSLKEKDEVKKSESAPTMVVSNATSGTSPKSAADKSGEISLQGNKKTMDGHTVADQSKVSGQGGEGDVFALSEKNKKEEKSGGKKSGSSKVSDPQKLSNGYYDLETTTSAPQQDSRTKYSQPTRSETSGKLDSVAVGGNYESAITVSDGLIAPDSAMIKYDKQDYAGAATGFEQILKQNPNDEKALFYSAVSYLSLGQADRSVANFNKILQNKNSKYFDDAQWYLSLAYIKKKDAQNARSNLLELKNNSRSNYRQKAAQTLDELDKK